MQVKKKWNPDINFLNHNITKWLLQNTNHTNLNHFSGVQLIPLGWWKRHSAEFHKSRHLMIDTLIIPEDKFHNWTSFTWFLSATAPMAWYDSPVAWKFGFTSHCMVSSPRMLHLELPVNPTPILQMVKESGHEVVAFITLKPVVIEASIHFNWSHFIPTFCQTMQIQTDPHSYSSIGYSSRGPL